MELLRDISLTISFIVLGLMFLASIGVFVFAWMQPCKCVYETCEHCEVKTAT